MIVPSMNIDEIRNEISKDYPIVFRKAAYVSDKTIKTLKLKRDETKLIYYDYLSKYKNRWIYSVYYTKKLSIFSFLHYNYDERGLNAILVSPDSGDYLIFLTAHFFKRYNERRRLKLIVPNDILRSFMEDNSSLNIQKQEKIGGDMSKIFCVSKSGILLGTEDKKHNILRMSTFLTTEMLSPNQKIIASDLRNGLDNANDYVLIDLPH